MHESVPLSSEFGVELRGLDPRLIPLEYASLFRQVFLSARIVLLRGCELTEDDNVRLTETLGLASSNLKSKKKFSYVSNVLDEGMLGDGELPLHSDFMFTERPLKAISLYATGVPAHGGETVFADVTLAYRRLPEALKMRIAGLQARHVANYGASRPKFDSTARETLFAIHPLVWHNPETRQPVLFASRLMTESIIGLNAGQSEALLQELFGYIEDPKYQYVHKWRVGDYLVWDNRCLQHSRRDFAPTEGRTLRRVPISG